MSEDEFVTEVRLGDQGVADEMAAWLRNAAADDVMVVRERGIIDPFSLGVLITFTTLNLGIIAQMALWIREKTRCRTIYDLRARTIQIKQDCSTRDGKVLIIDANGEMTIQNPDKLVELDKVLAVVLESGIHAVAKVLPGVDTSIRTP